MGDNTERTNPTDSHKDAATQADQKSAEWVQELYPLLRQIAARHLESAFNLTLQPTEFVNALYLRLVASKSGAQEVSREHFIFLASKIIRQLLNDHLRRKMRQKRGGGTAIDDDVTLSNVAGFEGQNLNMTALAQALDQLEGLDPAAVQVVELRVFGGYTTEEIASALGVGTATVTRKWSMAKAYLSTQMT